MTLMCGIRQSGPSRTPRSNHWNRTHVVRENFADFDPDTSACPKIYKRAARATGAAVEIACKALRGNRVSLRHVAYTRVHEAPIAWARLLQNFPTTRCTHF